MHKQIVGIAILAAATFAAPSLLAGNWDGGNGCNKMVKVCKVVQNCNMNMFNGGGKACFKCRRPQGGPNDTLNVCGRGNMENAQSKGFYCKQISGGGGGGGFWPFCQKVVKCKWVCKDRVVY